MKIICRALVDEHNNVWLEMQGDKHIQTPHQDMVFEYALPVSDLINHIDVKRCIYLGAFVTDNAVGLIAVNASTEVDALSRIREHVKTDKLVVRRLLNMAQHDLYYYDEIAAYNQMVRV